MPETPDPMRPVRQHASPLEEPSAPVVLVPPSPDAREESRPAVAVRTTWEDADGTPEAVHLDAVEPPSALDLEAPVLTKAGAPAVPTRLSVLDEHLLRRKTANIRRLIADGKREEALSECAALARHFATSIASCETILGLRGN